eukprot:COSAG02_NODE_244_length_27402_cov_41.050397_26_plen_80_part_00
MFANTVRSRDEVNFGFSQGSRHICDDACGNEPHRRLNRSQKATTRARGLAGPRRGAEAPSGLATSTMSLSTRGFRVAHP